MKGLLVLALGSLVVASQAVIVIDDFSVSQSALVRNTAGFSFNSVGLPSYGINSRLQYLNLNTTSDPDLIARATSRISSGAWRVSSDEGVYSSTGVLYSVLSPGGTALSMVGKTVRVNFLRLDQDVLLVSNITDPTAAGGGVGIAVQASTTPFSVYLDYSSLSSSVDLTNVYSLGFEIAGEAVDYAVDGIEVVPEPASMAALGIGALALARRRRKA